MVRFVLILSLFATLSAFPASDRFALHCALIFSKAVHRVALLEDPTCSGECLRESQRLLQAFGPAVQVERVAMRNLDPKRLEGFSAVVAPGGSLYAYSVVLGEKGQSAVRNFVQNGGAFIGTCAGAQLASELGLLPVRSDLNLDQGQTSVRLTPAGGNLSEQGPGKIRLYYQNGPRMELMPNADPNGVEVLGYFDTSRGSLNGSVAIVRGNFGRGKVFLFSPHPELSSGHEDLFSSAVISGLLESRE